MANITLKVVSINSHNFLTVPTNTDIEDVNIKYVFNHKKKNQYDTAYSDVWYYDEQSNSLAVIAVEDTPHEIFALYAGFTLITAEMLDSTEATTPMLINNTSTGYAVALSPKDPHSLVLIAYSALAGGTFKIGDTIKGSGTYATATVIFDDGVGFMVIHPVKGTLATTDNIENGATPNVTAAIDTYTAASQKYLQYEPGHTVAQKKKDIVARINALAVNYAVTAVDLNNNTVTISGDHQVEFTKDVPVFWDGSTANDGMYSVKSSIYGTSTVITFNQRIPNYIADGNLKTS